MPNHASRCPIARALDVFGDRWTLLIVRDLLFTGKTKFSQFADSHERIATNILSSRLARLEAEGVITRSPDPEHTRRHVYRLTDKGLDLVPVLLEMIEWSARYYPQPGRVGPLIGGAPADLRARLRRDRAGLVDEITSRVRRRG